MNNLSVEDLLKPRYKVIADYPASPFDIGEIIIPKYSSDDMREIVDDANRFFSLNDKDLHGNGDLGIYPAIFKKLQWWEERKESDMPEYAYDNENGGIGKVMNIIEGRGLCIGLRDNLVSWENCKPATKEEYNNQKIKV